MSSRKSSYKTIQIACLGTPSDYRTSLVPLIIQSLGYKINWVSPIRADLVVYGPFYDVNAPRLRWLPRVWRYRVSELFDAVENELLKRRLPPLTLFHTGENIRHNHIKADFAISHDLNISLERHFRLPYWMEVIDWSHEGIVGNSNPRYGELLQLEKLLAPLGDNFLKRAQKAVLITSHLREPRAFCLEALKKVMAVDGMGPYFDKEIKDHHQSNFRKKDILKNYAFNLCPENSAYPGYMTEKIPEAFMAGCLPITYVDIGVSVDFNPKAFINLYQFKSSDDQDVLGWMAIELKSHKYAEEALLLSKPKLNSLKLYVQSFIDEALA